MNNPGKYVKIPVTVEAIQWREDMAMRELMDFTNDLVRLNDVNQQFYVYDRLHDTWVKFGYGDYIIKGVKGEFYPCAKDVFEETYRQELFTQDEDLMTDEEIQEEQKPKKRNPKKGTDDPGRPPKGPGPGAVHIYQQPFSPYGTAQMLHDLAERDQRQRYLR